MIEENKISKETDSNFISVEQVIKSMGEEPTPEMVRWIEGEMDALVEQYDQGDPPLQTTRVLNGKTFTNISVAQVIIDMGLDPTPQLESKVAERMIEWFEHEFRNVVPTDDGGQTCYYQHGHRLYWGENFREKIEEIVNSESGLRS